ncbi:TrfB-related DNA-binding protein [Piscinibacter sakaiensis]|uniref:TrfB transcriptional repressor protein domain-containing protein n=1 Tax=Piscinibacter sakaiensis TaxID=1547922 RepID=A0A0K8NXM2_PISS1|nr:TrfB-related DNA-binding protein [Piscinibacter sakaiensis]GAP34655.1 hypothetical protein ISF6_5363 [Piscinibacter sakaiensis]
MTPEQFEALASLARLQATAESVRMVMVDGLSQVEAGERTGKSKQAVYRDVRKARQVLALARQACGLPPDSAA